MEQYEFLLRIDELLLRRIGKRSCEPVRGQQLRFTAPGGTDYWLRVTNVVPRTEDLATVHLRSDDPALSLEFLEGQGWKRERG